ncbi:hypothetical protein MTO96_016819 [Rhipicephalus appendiculatus]
MLRASVLPASLARVHLGSFLVRLIAAPAIAVPAAVQPQRGCDGRRTSDKAQSREPVPVGGGPRLGGDYSCLLAGRRRTLVWRLESDCAVFAHDWCNENDGRWQYRTACCWSSEARECSSFWECAGDLVCALRASTHPFTASDITVQRCGD